MDNETKDTLMVTAAILAAVLLAGAGIYLYSGAPSPFSVVVSESMQHGDESRYGVIDTGDMVYVRDPSYVHIRSYVEGAHTGYRSFGEYGSVIIYERGPGYNPVIHRAIVWLDYEGTVGGIKKWTAPYLSYYGDYTVDIGDPVNGMSGKLTLMKVGYGNDTVSIDLNALNPESGFLTKGDNAVTNGAFFDQNGGIAPNNPIGIDEIRSVPVMEMSAFGTVKMYFQGKGDVIPENSWGVLYAQIYAVAMFFLVLIILLDSLFVFLKERRARGG